MTDDFVHLHVHDDGSQLDGHATVDDYLDVVEELGQPAVGQTNHGNMARAYDLWKKTKTRKKERGVEITPIIGVEAYLAPPGSHGEPASRHHHKPIFWRQQRAQETDEQREGGDVSGAGAYTHQTLLAINAEGLRNLFAFVSRASLEGYYYKARGDHELLAQYSAGVVATTGCPSGAVQTRLRLGQVEAAEAAAAHDLEIFGRDRYFLEIMDHGIAIERDVRPALLALGKRLGLRPLATNDSHYARITDADAHDRMLAINSGKTLSDPKRFKFDGTGYYLKSAAEMRALFDETVPGACDNTLLVAEMVESYDEVFNPRDLMPKFPVPEGYTSATYLREVVYKRLRRIYGADLPAAVVERAEYELELVCRLGFADYFLVIMDMCEFMDREGIIYGPRGSAAGSIIIYALGVARLDPLRFGLMFERFINPDRVSPPDVDMDIEESRRDDVYAYLRRRWGADRTANIVTFGLLGGKAAIKDSARILGYDASVGDRISRAYPPPLFGKPMTIKDIYNPEHPRTAEGAGQELRALAETDPDAKRIVEAARTVEGRLRSFGQHACGFIVCSEPLHGIVPLITDNKKTRVSFEYPKAESMGLQKLDALGLKNLTMISEALKSIKRLHGVDIDLNSEDFDDPLVYRLLARGDTSSLFQLEGSGMQELLRRMRPTEFNDVMAALALYRPGPMGADAHHAYADRKTGRVPVEPVHEEIADATAEVLGETYGVICYQEQVMRVLQLVAGFSPGRADLVRKAMGKKDKAVLDKEKPAMREGMLERGYSEAAFQKLWETLEPFADYAFGRCVTGDTTITRLGRGSHEWSQTVRDVTNRLHGREDYDGSGCRYCYNEAGRTVSPRSAECKACKAWRAKWRMNGGMNAAGRVGDQILPVKIVDAFRQGVKPVWKMTLANGMSVTSTANHRHLTPDGWRRMDQLAVGVRVSTMSGLLPDRTTLRTDQPGANWVKTRGYYVDVRSHGKRGPFLHGRHSQLNRNIATMERKCAHCGWREDDGAELDRAHLDNNPLNNELGNLALLCDSCHKKQDYKTGSRVKMWRKGRAVESSEIVSIEYAGEEMTYDVTVDSEVHSWVANDGIVTHNSHSACYARVAYWTAYLKVHYPVEWMAAVLTAESDDAKKRGIYLAEARRMGIEVLVPDVNESGVDFTPTADGMIRFGLGAIVDVGAKVVDAIVSGRRVAPYRDFLDFLERVPPAACTAKAITALAQGGAFDKIESNRRAVAFACAAAAKTAREAKKVAATGQMDLFASPATVASAEEDFDQVVLTGFQVDQKVSPYDRDHQLDLERNRLGLYVSGHPLQGKEATLAAYRDETTAELLASGRVEGEVRLCGQIVSIERKVKKSDGKPWAILTLEDLDGQIAVNVYTRAYATLVDELVEKRIVSVKARLFGDTQTGGENDEEMLVEQKISAIFIDQVKIINPDEPVVVYLKPGRVNQELVDGLKRACQTHRGDQALKFRLIDDDGQPKWDTTVQRVAMRSPFISELKELVGGGAFTWKPPGAA